MHDELLCDRFQGAVDNYLTRHKSVLDSLSKLDECCARVNRSVAKAVTTCGCVKIQAEKQHIPGEVSLPELHRYLDTHLRGALCPQCKESVEEEIGDTMLYLTAICNLLELNLGDVLLKEHRKLRTLGVFNLC